MTLNARVGGSLYSVEFVVLYLQSSDFNLYT